MGHTDYTAENAEDAEANQIIGFEFLCVLRVLIVKSFFPPAIARPPRRGRRDRDIGDRSRHPGGVSSFGRRPCTFREHRPLELACRRLRQKNYETPLQRYLPDPTRIFRTCYASRWNTLFPHPMP